MGKKIDAYIDCGSPYSWVAFADLRRQRAALKQHGVEVEFHPIFLGAVIQLTKNVPPAAVPARGKYLLKYDLKRIFKYYNLLSDMRFPSFFPMPTLNPQRTMTYVKANYPSEKFEEVYNTAWLYVFGKHINISESANMEKMLGEHFDAGNVRKIMEGAQSQENKDKLAAMTKDVIEVKGAYGAPFLWLTNEQGKSEPVFGSDRMAYVLQFLEVPFEDITIKDGGSKL